MLNGLANIISNVMSLVDGILMGWVNLTSVEPLTPEGSAFIDLLARVAIQMAELIGQLADKLNSVA